MAGNAAPENASKNTPPVSPVSGDPCSDPDAPGKRAKTPCRSEMVCDEK